MLGQTSAALANFGYDTARRTTGTPVLDTLAYLIFTVPPWWWYQIGLSGGATVDSAYSVPLN